MIDSYDGMSEEKRQRIKEKIELRREEQTSQAVQEIIEFNKTPAELKAARDGFIIGQEQGKKIIRPLPFITGGLAVR